MTIRPASSSENSRLVGYWKGDKATELTRFIDMEFDKDGTGKREGELFKWDLEENTNLTISWLKLVEDSRYMKVMNDAESMQTISNQMKVYVVDGKSITILEWNDKYYEVTETDNYNIIELTNSSLKVSFRTQKGEAVQMSHTK